ncbi:hypothetical protein GOBAR_AA15388 [Gossypium barbadense]|uniref:Uncharacterized protein n=1 Tax=Gossypium barbadense TaxID=3634 RepID=A0A2P5XPM2_GOSBA|nr:hypothetical protein GOBAR_AA15388 [Gossypium barbadense]
MALASIKKLMSNKDDEDTQWPWKLFKQMCPNTRMLQVMKPFLDQSAISQGIEGLQWPKGSNESSISGADKNEEKEETEEKQVDECGETMEDDVEPYHDNF